MDQHQHPSLEFIQMISQFCGRNIVDTACCQITGSIQVGTTMAGIRNDGKRILIGILSHFADLIPDRLFIILVTVLRHHVGLNIILVKFIGLTEDLRQSRRILFRCIIQSG